MTGAEIRAAREARGWTQHELGERIGVGQRTIGNWERGETVPKNKMGRIEQILGSDRPGIVAESLSDAELIAEMARRLARSAQRPE